MEDLERIKERIAKLLRMAGDSSSPNEAAIAAQRARSLMDKYQIDAFDVTSDVAEPIIRDSYGRFFAAIPKHLDYLSTCVAQYNDCQSRWEFGWVDFKKKSDEAKSRGKRPSFCGYKSDVELAKQMYGYLTDSIDAMCKEYLKGLGYAKYPVRIGGQFKLGMTLQINDRLDALIKERDSLCMTGNGTALVVVKQKAVAEVFGEIKYGTSSTRQLESQDEADARMAGRIKGNQIEIIKSLDDQNE